MFRVIIIIISEVVNLFLFIFRNSNSLGDSTQNKNLIK